MLTRLLNPAFVPPGMTSRMTCFVVVGYSIVPSAFADRLSRYRTLDVVRFVWVVTLERMSMRSCLRVVAIFSPP